MIMQNEMLEIAPLMAEGQFERALDLARAALEKDPLDAEMCHLAGVCSIGLGNAIQAESFWSRALELAPDALEPRFNLGLLFLERNALRDAESCFREILRIAPENAAACANLALLLERAERIEEAGEYHRRAVFLAGNSAEIRFNFANFLTRAGALEQAKSAFLEVIGISPTHCGAWINLGNLLFDTGFIQAAHTAYSAAAAYHPKETSALVNLGNVLLQMDDPDSAERQFSSALSVDPALAGAHQGLASVYCRQGDMERAAHHRKSGFGSNPVSTLPCRGNGRAIPLLALASSLEGNVPWRFLIDRHVFETTIVAVEYFNAKELPEHELVFNAIGDADLCREGLGIAGALLEKTDAPVINLPERVLKTGRIENARRLSSLPGVVAPEISLALKEEIEGKFPLLLRTPGFHGGNFFVKVEDEVELLAAIGSLPGDRLMTMNFLDSRTGDGLYRKFRIMAIGGNLYPVHLAISGQWKVHYFSSDMAGKEEYRMEEASFLGDYKAYLGADAVSALERIRDELDLDYCGMDFGIDGNGRILLFEANATMSIVPPKYEPQWEYRRAAMTNALDAARRMFLDKLITSGRL